MERSKEWHPNQGQLRKTSLGVRRDKYSPINCQKVIKYQINIVEFCSDKIRLCQINPNNTQF